MTLCDRCGCTPPATTMSTFNTDVICLDCADDEKKAPGYPAAAAAELSALKAGGYNFPGVGLSTADRAFLYTRLEARRGA